MTGIFELPPFSPEWFLLNPVSLLAPARENGGNELAHAHSFCRCVGRGDTAAK